MVNHLKNPGERMWVRFLCERHLEGDGEKVVEGFPGFDHLRAEGGTLPRVDETTG